MHDDATTLEHHPRILVVDDEPVVRLALVDCLTDAGYDVIEASNGAEALERVSQLPADMILLDLYMPRMDGFAFLRARASGRSQCSTGGRAVCGWDWRAARRRPAPCQCCPLQTR